MTTRSRRPGPRAPATELTNGRKAVHYPDHDGKPMGETITLVQESIRLIDTLQAAFAGRGDVLAIGNVLLYFEEGNPRAVVVPDLMVIFDLRRPPSPGVYKLWEEQVPPTVVIEVTSPTTRRDDQVKKRGLYARLGVREYYLYDPFGEYLRPPLQGNVLQAGVYRTLEPDGEGTLVSDALGVRLLLVDGRLRLFHRRSGMPWLSPTERAEAERAWAEAEAARADAAERRIAELERLLRERTGSA